MIISRTQHKKILLALVDTLTETNCFIDIRVKLPGYDAPDPINSIKHGINFAPDVSAINDFSHFFVIETSGSLEDKGTESKWLALADHVNLNYGKLWVVVPKSLKQRAIDKMLMLDIHGGVLSL
jgi:hypothetical protein